MSMLNLLRELLVEDLSLTKTNIYNQDCLEVFRTISDSSVDLIVTDPPYPVMARGNNGSAGGMFLKKST